MNEKISNNMISTRAQALVLVSIMILAGSVAVAPAVFAATSTPITIQVESEDIGPMTVEVMQSTLSNCYKGAKIPVLQVNITNTGGVADTFDHLEITYSGDDILDVTFAELRNDTDGSGDFNPLNDVIIGAPVAIIGNPITLPVAQDIGPGLTEKYWILFQTYDAATTGNVVDAYIAAGGIGFTAAGVSTVDLDPTDSPDFCTIEGFGPMFPEPIYGFVMAEDKVTPINLAVVTFTEEVTGETLVTASDATGRYDFDLNALTLGFTDGDSIKVESAAPNQGYNSTTLVTGTPQTMNITVDTTYPITVLSIVPDYNNTGSWNVDFTWVDPLVNGYNSTVYAVDIFVETPATPGVFNYWKGQMDTWITGTELYTPTDGEGNYSFYALALDYAGNNESAIKALAAEDWITYDITDPTSTVTGPADSDVQSFNVIYSSDDPIAVPSGDSGSGVANLTLWWTNDGGTSWNKHGDYAITGSVAVDVGTMSGDGTYGWYTAAWDNASNNEAIPPVDATFIEFSTLVDSGAPLINATSIDKYYINSEGTFGGIAPPVSITTSLFDPNLEIASVGIRNNNSLPNATFYVTFNASIDGYTNQWDGNWYFIDGYLVTASFDVDVYGTDIVVFGELNGTSDQGDIIGNVAPDYYADFNSAGVIQNIYATQGTTATGDDVEQDLYPAACFTPYTFVDGTGFVAGYNHTTGTDTLALTWGPAADGQYAIVVGAGDTLQNTNETNETDGNPVITVDNYAPTGTALGPGTNTALTFPVTYTAITDPAPSSGIANMTLYYTDDGGSTWNIMGYDTDLTSPITVTVPGDGTYGWCVVSRDNTANTETVPTDATYIETSTLVDTSVPLINATSIDKYYINTQGTFDGTPPPVNITTSLWDENLALGSVGIRNYNGAPNSTFYATYNATVDGYINEWNGNWYFIDGILVTVSFDDAWGTDIKIFGDLNGSRIVGEVIGNVIPDYYALFDSTGVIQNIYSTNGTVIASDDVPQGTAALDWFWAYNYTGGTGFAAVVNHTNTGTLNLVSSPAADGQYAVVVSAIDILQNSNYTNEDSAVPTPMITVDNIQPTLTTEYVLSTDLSGNGYIDTGDTITIWVNVTDVNEDGTCPMFINVTEFGFPVQSYSGVALTYAGGGVWTVAHVVAGPQFTTSNISADFKDLASNQIVAINNATFDIYGQFTLNYEIGWNLMSIPVLNPEVAGTPLLTADDIANLGAAMVSKWDFAGQRYINYIAGFHLPGEPQDFALLPDEAYWMWMPIDGSIDIDGERPGARSVNVQGPGWNLVGYVQPVTVGDVETDWAPSVACGAYDDIAYYDGVTFQHYIFAGTVMPLTPGRGYFVWSDAAATINYGN